MDISALKKDTLEVWCDFEDGIRVKIRHLTRERILDIAKESVKVEFDRKSRRRTEDVDIISKEVLIAQASVVDWEGITDDGEPFPCTPDNIEFLMRRWGLFAKFVTEVAADLNTLLEEERRQTEKNS